MNPLQSTSASKDDPPNAIKKVLSLGQEPVSVSEHAKTRKTDTNSAEMWSLIVTGCLLAAMIASVSCRLPISHTFSWTSIFFLSLKLIALAAAAGAIGISIPWFFLREKPPFGLGFLSRKVAVGWIFFPCITLLYRQQSPGMFLVLALATIALSFSLRRLFPASPETDKLPAWHNADLRSLYGLPIADFRPVRALLIAACFQAAFVLAIAEFPLFAGMLLSTCLFLLTWRWNVSSSKPKTEPAEKRRQILLGAFALFFTVLALIPWVAGRSNDSSARNKVPHRPALITHESNESAVPGSDYVGIILWPPPIKKTEITPPRPHSDSLAIGKASKPVVIPFDGQYWYFKAPSKRPGPRAHVAHGKAMYVNVRSTDSSPLLMEAYQNLGTSIDLRCCSEIDLAITNNDVRPGTIALGLRLTDSDSIEKPSQDLAEQTIVSSKAAQIPLNRPPIEEVLRFPISRSTTMRRFDEITVVFLPAKERARSGAKVSVQSFTLIPQ